MDGKSAHHNDTLRMTAGCCRRCCMLLLTILDNLEADASGLEIRKVEGAKDLDYGTPRCLLEIGCRCAPHTRPISNVRLCCRSEPRSQNSGCWLQCRPIKLRKMLTWAVPRSSAELCLNLNLLRSGQAARRAKFLNHVSESYRERSEFEESRTRRSARDVSNAVCPLAACRRLRERESDTELLITGTAPSRPPTTSVIKNHSR